MGFLKSIILTLQDIFMAALAEAARGSWLAVLLGVQSMDWWGGGGGGWGGGAWEPAQAPSILPITLHTGPCIYNQSIVQIARGPGLPNRGES